MAQQQAAQTQPSQGRKVKLINAVGYAFGDLYGGGYGGISNYLILFWVTFCGFKMA